MAGVEFGYSGHDDRVPVDLLDVDLGPYRGSQLVRAHRVQRVPQPYGVQPWHHGEAGLLIESEQDHTTGAVAEGAEGLPDGPGQPTSRGLDVDPAQIGAPGTHQPDELDDRISHSTHLSTRLIVTLLRWTTSNVDPGLGRRSV